MISVEEALGHILNLAAPLEIENLPLREAFGRVLAETVQAKLTQPPFAASAMDGYALRKADLDEHSAFKVIGEAAAGKGFAGTLAKSQTVRIFTGAPVPNGADFVVIQEDVARNGDVITISDPTPDGPNIRAAGQDFEKGTEVAAGTRLTSAMVALLASMNIAEVPVRRRPVLALVATGNELVTPGETPGPDQIVASNNLGLAALFEALGCEVRLLPIARDNADSLRFVLGLARGADMIVTIGGASVGDHDIVQDVAADEGLELSFYKVAMRPGKPLLAGKIGASVLVGLPGNPVSSMVCAHVFLRPAIAVMQGHKAAPAKRKTALLAQDLPKNGPRAHYMRAEIQNDGEVTTIRAAERQDSALLSVLTKSNALLIRPVNDPARKAGKVVEYLPIDL